MNHLTTYEDRVSRIENPFAFSLLPFALFSLHLSSLLYKFAPFMQNEPNLLNAQMNVTSILTNHYGNNPLCRRHQNEPKRTQNEPNFSPASGPQSQNEPNLSRRTPPCHAQVPYQAGLAKPDQTQSLYHCFCLLFIIASNDREFDRQFYVWL
jgi:hypothetical protein